MFSLRDLRFVVCSRDLDILRAQRIIGVFTHKSTRSENPIPRPPRLKNRKLTRREASDNRVKKKQSGRKDKQRNHFFFSCPCAFTCHSDCLPVCLSVCQYVSVCLSALVCLAYLPVFLLSTFFFSRFFFFHFCRISSDKEPQARIRRDPNGYKLPMSPSCKYTSFVCVCVCCCC